MAPSSLLRLTAPPLCLQVEIERLLEKDRAIMGEFNTAIGDGNKFQELLLKIFKKKVERQQTRWVTPQTPHTLTAHFPIYR